jgi:hypothetical protein
MLRFIWHCLFVERPVHQAFAPLVATLPKNSFSSKKKVATLYLKITIHLILRISDGFRMS